MSKREKKQNRVVFIKQLTKGLYMTGDFVFFIYDLFGEDCKGRIVSFRIDKIVGVSVYM